VKFLLFIVTTDRNVSHGLEYGVRSGCLLVSVS